jgi:hypothetical protein
LIAPRTGNFAPEDRVSPSIRHSIQRVMALAPEASRVLGAATAGIQRVTLGIEARRFQRAGHGPLAEPRSVTLLEVILGARASQ